LLKGRADADEDDVFLLLFKTGPPKGLCVSDEDVEEEFKGLFIVVDNDALLRE